MKAEFVISPSGLLLSDVKKIISNKLSIKLSKESIIRIKNNRNFLNKKLIDNNQVYYGINTGFGSLCNELISNSDLKKLQVNLVKSHACGAGKEIDLPIIKLMLLLKVNALSMGFSGVTLNTIEKLIFLFNNDILPVVYKSGSFGATGDVTTLAQLFLL